MAEQWSSLKILPTEVDNMLFCCMPTEVPLDILFYCLVNLPTEVPLDILFYLSSESSIRLCVEYYFCRNGLYKVISSAIASTEY